VSKVKIDRSGIQALLKSSGVASEVEGYADGIAASVLSHPSVASRDIDVETASGVSDRARTIVTIMHAAGLGLQAKHGVLSRAVGDSGLKFVGRAE
jgi:hypothetical protein